MNPGGERGHNTSELGHLNNPTDLIFFFGGKVMKKKIFTLPKKKKFCRIIL